MPQRVIFCLAIFIISALSAGLLPRRPTRRLPLCPPLLLPSCRIPPSHAFKLMLLTTAGRSNLSRLLCTAFPDLLLTAARYSQLGSGSANLPRGQRPPSQIPPHCLEKNQAFHLGHVQAHTHHNSCFLLHPPHPCLEALGHIIADWKGCTIQPLPHVHLACPDHPSSPACTLHPSTPGVGPLPPSPTNAKDSPALGTHQGSQPKALAPTAMAAPRSP